MNTPISTISTFGRRPSASPFTLPRVALILAICCLAGGVMARPRPPLPPLPELAPLLYRAHFDFDFAYSRRLTDAVVTVPDFGELVESFSGYALLRAGSKVPPFIIPAVDLAGRANVAGDSGVVRCWVRPRWSSASVAKGTGPGVEGRLFELTVGSLLEFWSLRIAPDGSVVYLTGESESGAKILLQAPLAWAAGQWHLISLDYGPNGTALFLDGELAATGAGVLAAPAPLAQLVIGSTADGTEAPACEFEEVSLFGRARSKAASTGIAEKAYFQLSQPTVALGPITAAEDAAPRPAKAQPAGAGAPLAMSMAGFPPCGLWLEIVPSGSNAVILTLHNTTPTNTYVIQSKETFSTNSWMDETAVLGTNGDCTEVTIQLNGRPTLFFRAREVAPNRIQTENARTGNPQSDWFPNTGCNHSRNHEIEGYAKRTSYNRGDTIEMCISSSSPVPYAIKVFRMGYYGGRGARLVHEAPTLQTASQQPIPPPNPTNGLIQCDWPTNFTIPGTITTDWVSGVYLTLLQRNDGWFGYVLFVLRDDCASSDYLMGLSMSTYAAYNHWGGKSLYGTQVFCAPPQCTNWLCSTSLDFHQRAFKVSFNRPFQNEGTGEFLSGGGGNGGGGWEYDMVLWLERQGYDVTYCTSLDLHENGALLGLQNGSVGPLKHKAYLSVGHDEYWSNEMRQNVEDARDRGVNLGFFSANSCYWRVKFEDDNRTMVCYKDGPVNGQSDPYIIDATNATQRWRDPPINNPEINLIGVQYVYGKCRGGTFANDPIVLPDPLPNHWIYEYAGVQGGTNLLGLLGYEADGYWNSYDTNDPLVCEIRPSPPGTLVTLARSPFNLDDIPSKHAHSEASIYTAASGAMVFATGSMGWNYGLDFWAESDNFRINPSVQQMTHNVLRTFAGRTNVPVLLLKSDTANSGSWAGHYGNHGYIIPNSPSSFTNCPTYVSATISGAQIQVWTNLTHDPRGLPIPGSSNRIASAWTTTDAQNNGFTIDLNFTDPSPQTNHTVTLYCADWLGTGTVHERIEVFDYPDIANPLEVRDFRLSTNGIYLQWKLKGHKTIRITKPDAASGNKAMVSAIFFDP